MSERLTPPEQPAIGGRSIEAWRDYLNTYNGEPNGHLATPCSRYGRDADSCSWYAVALLAIFEAHGAEPEEAEAIIDHAMSLVVNDNDDVAQTILEHREYVPQEVLDHLDLEALSDSAEAGDRG